MYIILGKTFGSLTKKMYFGTDFKIMTTTEAILNYAAKKRGTFLRKDLSSSQEAVRLCFT